MLLPGHELLWRAARRSVASMRPEVVYPTNRPRSLVNPQGVKLPRIADHAELLKNQVAGFHGFLWT